MTTKQPANHISPTAVRCLLGIYPARWRVRYGDEFAAFLAQMPVSLPLVLDTVRGALDAHLHPSLSPGTSWDEIRTQRNRRHAMPIWLVACLVAVILVSSDIMPVNAGRHRRQGAAIMG